MNKLFIKKILLASIIMSSCKLAVAQDVDLFKSMDEQNKKDKNNQTDYTTATFKTTRLINGQSIENVGAGLLDVKISHRFGSLNKGAYELWGLDNAQMRMGVDYGINRWLMVGVGRNSFEKTYDGFIKSKIIRQSTGQKNMPIAVSAAISTMWKTVKDDALNNYTDRYAFAPQLIIARKFSDYISLQIMPTVVHYNSVSKSSDPNDYYSIGMGGRLRLSRRVNLTTEYYYRITQQEGYVNSLSAGFDIETGGHVFQFHFTNTQGMTEGSYINQTTEKWTDGGVHFGFNIARIFVINKPKDIKP